MKTWVICTGGKRWTQKSTDEFSAAVAAFTRKPPKSAGLLTMVYDKQLGEDHPNTAYTLTTRVLEACGYGCAPAPAVDG